MAEQPLNRFYVASYAANDRDFPIVAIRLDPRVAGYRVPEDLSPHPDSKRYPNHVFTGSQPSNGDERVTHIYEILPSPWVPFTRYDDDLGPIQGRRRSVKNEGQQASLTSSTKISYEGREGSAIVSNEIEESWSIAVDEDGNSLFPVRVRDFYDASRGAVQETRQLFVPTGEEKGTLENINGVITQTSYDVYNEYLSFKIVETYSVDGPQLVGKSTNNEGQLVTVTTQRKGASTYVAPEPTALKTIEVSREDAESLIERIVDTPKVFEGKRFSVERPDNVPQKFKASLPVVTTEISIEGQAQLPILQLGDFAKSEQQVTDFVKRTSATKRDLSVAKTLVGSQYTSELGGGIATVTETYPFNYSPPKSPEFGVIVDEIEDLGDGTKIRREIKLKPYQYVLEDFDDDGERITVNSLQPLRGQDYDEELDLVIPYQQVVAEPKTEQITTGGRRRVTPRDVSHSLVQKYDVNDVQETLDGYFWELPDMVNINLPDKLIRVQHVVDSAGGGSSGSGFGDTYFYSSSSRNSTNGSITYDIEQGYSGPVQALKCIFFLPKESSSPNAALKKIKKECSIIVAGFWPFLKPESHLIQTFGRSIEASRSKSVSFNSGSESTSGGGSSSTNSTTIPPTLHPALSISGTTSVPFDKTGSLVKPRMLAATNPTQFPAGNWIISINGAPYKFSYVRIDAVVAIVNSEYT